VNQGRGPNDGSKLGGMAHQDGAETMVADSNPVALAVVRSASSDQQRGGGGGLSRRAPCKKKGGGEENFGPAMADAF
jgi:hypothetical protein